jgi:rhodanese-related sulfurtransferase
MSNQIDIDTLQDWLDSRRPVTILDVRNDSARVQWSIPGSVHVDAYDELRAGRAGPLASVDLPHDRPVVAVCNAGRLSRTAADVSTAATVERAIARVGRAGADLRVMDVEIGRQA